VIQYIIFPTKLRDIAYKIYIIRLLVNKFTVLEVEEYNKDNNDISDIPPCLFHTNITVPTKYSKWEKKLGQA